MFQKISSEFFHTLNLIPFESKISNLLVNLQVSGNCAYNKNILFLEILDQSDPFAVLIFFFLKI